MTAVRLGPDHDLAKRLSALEQTVAGLATRDVLQNASIGAGGLTVESGGSINVNGGNLFVENGSLSITGQGAAFVNGLKLSSLAAAQVNVYQSNFAIPATNLTQVASGTIPVPDGYSQAVILATGSFEFQNPTASATEAWGKTFVNGGAISSPQMDIQIDAGGITTMTLSMSGVISGMTGTGNVLTLTAQVAAQVALAASIYQAVSINGVAIFLA